MPPSHSPVSLATRQVDGVTVNAVSVGRQLRDRNVDVRKLRRLYVFNVCSMGVSENSTEPRLSSELIPRYDVICQMYDKN